MYVSSGLLGKNGFSQVRGYTTVTQSPIGLCNSSLPTRPTNRALHAGRVLSGPVANRPLSPHLPLKKPQFSATFSISHRIFGMALGTAIMLTPLVYKFSLQFDVWKNSFILNNYWHWRTFLRMLQQQCWVFCFFCDNTNIFFSLLFCADGMKNKKQLNSLSFLKFEYICEGNFPILELYSPSFTKIIYTAYNPIFLEFLLV